MTTYDGVPVKIITENTRGDLLLEVTKLMDWKNAPLCGEKFWINSDDKHVTFHVDGQK